MSLLVIPSTVLEDTLRRLKAGGVAGEERMIAWLGRDAGTGAGRVRDAYEPEQHCRRDQFYIPPASMVALMLTLGRTRSKIVAQIHTHPGKAYHSEADAAWAIIRHRGALSLVLPQFATTTTVSSFLDEVKTYERAADGEWVLVSNACLEIEP